MGEFHRRLAELLEAGTACATATLVDAVGSTPGKQGHRMIVLEDRSLIGTVGGGPLEASVIEDCLLQLERGLNAVREYRLVPQGEGSVGMVCGGTVRIFIEVHPAAPALLVFGAGHVGLEVIEMARGLGFRRILADDRSRYLEAAHVPAGTVTFHCAAGYTGDLPAVDAATYVVIVTRCHATDTEILARLAGSEAAYLGMIGSRRKVASILATLEERGVDRVHLERLRAPIGLDIGARSPREIAVAILAELIAVREKRPVGAGLALSSR
jgi:xanthine dehydrogenase accessory factor